MRCTICSGQAIGSLIRSTALAAVALLAAGILFASSQESGTRIPVRLAYCPPEQSEIPVLTRQAFDEGRELEGRQHGELIRELSRASTSHYDDELVLDSAFAAVRTFVQSMQARGHDIDFGDIIVHEETMLNSMLSRLQLTAIRRAQLELQLATITQMKRRICPQ
jgi:hypothetical protein